MLSDFFLWPGQIPETPNSGRKERQKEPDMRIFFLDCRKKNLNKTYEASNGTSDTLQHMKPTHQETHIQKHLAFLSCSKKQKLFRISILIFPKKNRGIFAIADMYGQKAEMEICTLARGWTHVQSAWWCSFCKMPSKNIFCL